MNPDARVAHDGNCKREVTDKPLPRIGSLNPMEWNIYRLARGDETDLECADSVH
jgi:hypothetical protein